MSVMIPRKEFSISVAIQFQESTVDEFRIVPSQIGNKIYQVGQLMTKPFEREMDLATRLFHPTPGIVKDESEKSWKDTAIRVLHALEVCTLIIPIVTGILALLGLALRAIVTAVSRPDALLLRNDKVAYKEGIDDEIHLMTYNTALMPKFVCNLNETRDPTKRAQEIADAIQAEGDHMPDVICFQEVFDSRSAKVLVEGLTACYPDIVYNVAPTEFGLNSGLVIASKYDIDKIDFKGFSNLKSEDWLSSKGLLGVALDLGGSQSARVYTTHLQAKSGEKYEQIRNDQLSAIQDWMVKDKTPTFCCGDFNFKDETKMELGDLKNAFYADHIIGNGVRDTQMSAAPFAKDVEGTAMSEPQGSWYCREDLPQASWGTLQWDQVRTVDKLSEKGPKAMQDIIFAPLDTISSTQVRNLGPNMYYRSGMSDHLPISLLTTRTEQESESDNAFSFSSIDEDWQEYANLRQEANDSDEW
ncbi:MAG: hypothetical protein K940chlam9_00467 [Chlamydiae bacterium]|nr:hypothetical protein [Chlamydiota bacterium]